ncbi:hypothetical protein E2562_038560 [Oryza meyeriana var. granulata]|uniref:Uncharacterized protein n=1 Tax=Oryza meyeriana var. granulata TaxID=110450 RepID=A0A6G1F2D6_9ORYZ|nr:hypothetical protein E2562_038560 [Oryza meyeriana var. granulata]
MGYGHHWHSCKEGNLEEYQAMLDERGPPKKRKKSSVPSEKSIVPAATTSSAPTMFYPQRSALGTGSNQLEPIHLVIPLLAPEESTPPLVVDKQKPKAKPNKKKIKTRISANNKINPSGNGNVTPQAQTKGKGKVNLLSPNSPAMKTRSKKKLVV